MRVKNQKTAMTTPKKWPLWPLLPITRVITSGKTGRKVASAPECGVIHKEDVEKGKKITVHVVHVFRLRDVLDGGVKKLSYDSIDALIEDGWEVDVEPRRTAA